MFHRNVWKPTTKCKCSKTLDKQSYLTDSEAFNQKYRLKKRLGEGGFGCVYLAELKDKIQHNIITSSFGDPNTNNANFFSRIPVLKHCSANNQVVFTIFDTNLNYTFLLLEKK